jgi:two-component system response regulator HydG
MAEALKAYDFPGNVRELEHMVEQAIALAHDEGTLTPDDLLPAPESSKRVASAPSNGQTLAEVTDNAEREAIEHALQKAEGNRERAAEALAISPTTLWRKMTRLGISFETKQGA